MIILLSTVKKRKILVAAILEIVHVSTNIIKFSIYRIIYRKFIFSNVQKLFVSVTEAAKWDEWSAWSKCYLKDGAPADCWKDKDDPPKATRTRICIKETSKRKEVCNEETRNCANLPICTFGEISCF